MFRASRRSGEDIEGIEVKFTINNFNSQSIIKDGLFINAQEMKKLKTIKKDNFTIHFIMTGGTIDSYYDGKKDTVVPSVHSIIPRFIEGMKLYNKTIFSEVCMKDSREITKKDLRNILNKIEKSTSTRIIITHGTYTMSDSARFIKANIKRKDQTIILTGSMVPIAEFTMSDGGFNLGYAVSKVQDLLPGVYVCMNGSVFFANDVVKSIDERRFFSIIKGK